MSKLRRCAYIFCVTALSVTLPKTGISATPTTHSVPSTATIDKCAINAVRDASPPGAEVDPNIQDDYWYGGQYDIFDNILGNIAIDDQVNPKGPYIKLFPDENALFIDFYKYDLNQTFLTSPTLEVEVDSRYPQRYLSPPKWINQSGPNVTAKELSDIKNGVYATLTSYRDCIKHNGPTG